MLANINSAVAVLEFLVREDKQKTSGFLRIKTKARAGGGAGENLAPQLFSAVKKQGSLKKLQSLADLF